LGAYVAGAWRGAWGVGAGVGVVRLFVVRGRFGAHAGLLAFLDLLDLP